MLLGLLLKGIIVGMIIAVPVGPVGVLCVRRTLFEGPYFGLVSGLGAAVADTIFGIIAGFGLTFVRDWLLGWQDWLGAAGGIFLLYTGARALLAAQAEEPAPLQGEDLMAAFASTFALTVTNPITILAFTAIFAKVGFDGDDVSFLEISLLVVGVFLGSLIWWLGLSFGLDALRRLWGHVSLIWINRVSGGILLISGAGLLGAASFALARTFKML